VGLRRGDPAPKAGPILYGPTANHRAAQESHVCRWSGSVARAAGLQRSRPTVPAASKRSWRAWRPGVSWHGQVSGKRGASEPRDTNPRVRLKSGPHCNGSGTGSGGHHRMCSGIRRRGPPKRRIPPERLAKIDASRPAGGGWRRMDSRSLLPDGGLSTVWSRGVCGAVERLGCWHGQMVVVGGRIPTIKRAHLHRKEA